MLSEQRKKSVNHSVSEPSTLLHKLCVTSQLLNRMTFENVTNITQLVPVTRQSPNCNIQNIWICCLISQLHRPKQRWIILDFINSRNHPDKVSLSWFFCSVRADIPVFFTVLSLACGACAFVCVTPFSPVLMKPRGSALQVQLCVHRVLQQCVCEMTSQPSRATPYNATAVTKDQHPAHHTPGAAF